MSIPLTLRVGCNHLNPPPLARLKLETASRPLAGAQSNPDPSPALVASAPSPLSKPNTRANRQAADRGRVSGPSTPRSSRLSKEVFPASEGEADGDEDDQDMEVDGN
jgi:hypothetical protein